jgi:Mg-chelatase subunit ChlD
MLLGLAAPIAAVHYAGGTHRALARPALRPQAQSAGPPRSACNAVVTETVAPAQLCVRDPDSITESAQVTVTASLTCPTRLPLHVVFSVQNDCWGCAGREEWSRRNKNSAATAARDLANLAPSTAMCGVVEFGCGTRVQLAMTHDPAECADAITRVQPFRGRCIMPSPVEERLLRDTRVGEPPAIEVIVRYVRDPWNGSGAAWVAAQAAISRLASEAHAVGIHQSNICDSGFRLDPESGGTPCDFTAGLPDRALYHDVRQAGKVSSDLRDLAALGQGVRLSDVTLSEVIGPQFDWAAGTGAPPPRTDPRNPQRLEFGWVDLSAGQVVTATYRVRPRTVGVLPLRTSASALRMIDSLGRVSEPIMIPMRALTVTECTTPTTPVAPTALPEPTARRPTSTPETTGSVPTHTATVTRAPTLAASATSTRAPTPTAELRPAYLPLALREHCTPGRQRIDVALVIDASSSMTALTTAGRSKLAAAVDAAQAFIDLLALPDDRVALVTFNADAYLLRPLTGTRADIDGAFNEIATAQQSCLSCAVEVAHRELVGPRHRGMSQAVMIVLSDGRANPEPASLAVDKALAAKADGVVIFTVGTGDDGDTQALAEIASRSSYFYRTADAEQLRQIYACIAVAIPCPPEQYWGRR